MENDRFICKECSKDLVLLNIECNKCSIQNCVKCGATDDSILCEICDEGYVSIKGQCLMPPEI